MPVYQAPNPPLAPASQTGPTVTSQVASTGNTGSSLSSARADHAHAASVDSLRTAPATATGTATTFDVAFYDNLEWTLPVPPSTGEAVAWDGSQIPIRTAYYVTLTVAYTSPNTSQRPSGKMAFKQPASGQITHQVRIATPGWATGGVKGLTTVTPTDATGKTLAQGGSCPDPYQCLTIINPAADPANLGPFASQIYEVEFHPLYDGTNWTLVFGTVSNAAGGGIRLAGGAPYTVGGGGFVKSTANSVGLSIETLGDLVVNGETFVNSLTSYTSVQFNCYSDAFLFRYPSITPTINPVTPSTGIPTYFLPNLNSSVWEWQLPNTASIGLSFSGQGFNLNAGSAVGGAGARQFGYLLVRQPISGQVVNSITFYFLTYTYGTNGAIRGITTISSPPNPNRPDIGDQTTLNTTLTPAAGTVVRDPMSPDLNPQQGFGAITIYYYQYLFDGARWYVLVRKLPAYAIAAGNPASLPQVASATSGQVLTVDSTGMQTWATLPSATVSVNGLMTTTQVSTLSTASAVTSTLAAGVAATVGRLTVDAILETPTSVTYAATLNLDTSIKNDFVITALGGNLAITFTNVAAGRQGFVAVRQDSTTAGRTVSFAASGWTVYRDSGTVDLIASPAVNTITVYTYAFITIAGVNMLLMGKLTPVTP